MRTLFLRAALLAALLAVASPGYSQERSGASAFGHANVALGVYDPHSKFVSTGEVRFEHIFIYWQALDLSAFRASLHDAHRRGRAMMVTVEPYTRALNWRDGGERLFSDILYGSFSREIATICREMGDFEDQILVRWGHEMENPTGRYPWARDDNLGYRAAYRHFVEDCRRHAPNALFVWSPIGERNLAAYYPGDSHVDLVGLSVWGLQAYDRKYFDGDRDFPRTFAEKYARAAAFGKPVIIAELGVSGDRQYRDSWFRSLFENVIASTEFDKLRAVFLFNDKEPHHWPMGLGSPDWRVDPAYLTGIRRLTQQMLTAAR
jgi:endoglucanase